MKIVTVEQIQRLDQLATERYGVPSLSLMENAGRSVAQEVLQSLRGKKNARVVIVCGLGNNGGDGFVAARHLINAGIKPKIFLLGNFLNLKNDAAINARILRFCRYDFKEVVAIDVSMKQAFRRADILVDAIFGVGLNRDIVDPIRSVIEAMNAVGKIGKRIIAVDIPSGLDGTTGKIYGTCLKADTTVTFTFAKRGFFRRQGPGHVGKIVVVDIGIPRILVTRRRVLARSI